MIEVIWHAPAYDPSGYAACAREYMKALHKNGVKVRFEPITFWSPIAAPAISGEEYDLIKSLEEVGVSQYAPKVHHTVPDIYRFNLSDGRAHIGYTVFETDGLPVAWIPKMMKCRKIFIPTGFNYRTFYKSGIPKEKMAIIPHIVPVEQYNPENYKPIDILIKKDFYFLTVMDVTHRKGWDILLRAYLREFRRNKNVGLVFKGYFGGVEEQHKRNLINRLKSFKDSLKIKNPPDIIFYGDILDNKDLPRLYKACHCFILSSRGEGFGLPAAEAMSMELPTIVTGWSGFTEYANNENAYLIDVIGFRQIDDEMTKITPNYEGHRWAEPSEEHLRRLMREVYENYNEAKLKGKKARQDMIDNFSADIIAQKIIKELKKL